MIILASSSPRRVELLKYIYPEFTVRPSDCDEDIDTTDPAAMVMELAARKCMNVAAHYAPEDIVIAADTCVYINDTILGKPVDRAQAYEYLSLLSGRRHTVFTGVCVSNGGKTYGMSAETAVTFQRLSHRMIEDYISSGEPMDKAGAYGIQGRGALLVESIEGDFYNVMGLPVSGLFRLLSTLGLAE